MTLHGLFLLFFGFQQTYGWWWATTVCYHNYGCFSDKDPFTNSEEYLPESPESIPIRLKLYTRRNRKTAAIHNTVIRKRLNFWKDTKIIIHGYKNTDSDNWVLQMKDAFLQKDDFNVYVLDWTLAASSSSYYQSVANTRIVAAMTYEKLKQIYKFYYLYTRSIHLIGYSLGAHVAGYLGNAIPGLDRITGLDPAGPGFEGEDAAVRLDPGDATFVDVVHTDAEDLLNIDITPGFGTKQTMGHVDFYVNGGRNQPGCPTITQHIGNILWGDFNTFGCSHSLAIDVFIESINSECKFTSTPCAQLPMVPCKANATNNFMGYHADRKNIGTFRTNTTDKSPFCLS